MDTNVNYSPSFIDSLCDIIPNKKRTIKHFHFLLKVIEEAPKECTPFKAKIIQHLQIHALGNTSANLRLLALCYAKATILFRKGQNKSEGPVAGWKEGFKNQLLELEKNLNHLYDIANINTNNVVALDNTDQEDNLKPEIKLSETKSDYKSIINNYLLKVNWSAHCLCALISIKTEFDLPISIQVLLKISQKIGLLRWRDYKKKPNTLIRSYVFSLTSDLIDINLMLFHTMVTVLGSNIIPFTQFINQTILRMLQWTRTSNLIKHDEMEYYSIRSKLFKIMSYMIEQLSLNINLESDLFKQLIEDEILESLNCPSYVNDCMSGSDGRNHSEMILMKNIHMVDALYCLENLLIVYATFLEPSLEGKVKSYVLQTFIKIYRDFESNVINLECRKQLLKVLQVVANQPYATSTTEISYHIFELVERLENDRDMKAVARKCLKIGLAHRPIIVTHYDVYNSYNLPMEKHINGSLYAQEVSEEDSQEADQHHQVTQQVEEKSLQEPQTQQSPQPQNLQPQKEQLQHQPPPPQHSSNGEKSKVDEEDDCQVLSYMSHFVEKLA